MPEPATPKAFYKYFQQRPPVDSLRSWTYDGRVILGKMIIVGTSGCGKTYLAKRLSEVTGIPWVDLDDLHWLPDWVERPDEEKIALVKQAVSKDQWILCGNVSNTRDLIWSRADRIIWLDMPLWLCLERALKRSLVRCVSGETCCNGNVETVRRLLGRNSIVRWVFRSHRRRRRQYSEFFATHSADPRLVRLKSRREVNEFVREIENEQQHQCDVSSDDFERHSALS